MESLFQVIYSGPLLRCTSFQLSWNQFIVSICFILSQKGCILYMCIGRVITSNTGFWQNQCKNADKRITVYPFSSVNLLSCHGLCHGPHGLHGLCHDLFYLAHYSRLFHLTTNQGVFLHFA